MKATNQNGVEEINTAKIKMSGLDKNKISNDSLAEESQQQNNIHNIISKAKDQNNNTNNMNYGLSTTNNKQFKSSTWLKNRNKCFRNEKKF
jgi:hypothetical protein